MKKRSRLWGHPPGWAWASVLQSLPSEPCAGSCVQALVAGQSPSPGPDSGTGTAVLTKGHKEEWPKDELELPGARREARLHWDTSQAMCTVCFLERTWHAQRESVMSSRLYLGQKYILQSPLVACLGKLSSGESSYCFEALLPSQPLPQPTSTGPGRRQSGGPGRHPRGPRQACTWSLDCRISCGKMSPI